ncbi:MAG: hypothetical protein WA964_20105 [Ilumatobacter sp.]|uniref:RCC1 domain-containing protein n=1 Tax=Ilumatobacter sp. TaxID=1967498 RepID=UPI003C7208F8
MKRLLMGFALMLTALIGVTGPSAEVGAEPAESPEGDSRDVAARLANGHTNACIILDNEQVRCWGNVLGTGVPGSGTIGDDETPDRVRTVDVGEGRSVDEVDGGQGFTCSLLDNGDVRCWGAQTFGPVIGVPASAGQRIGTSSEPTEIPPIDLGGRATQLASGNFHSCAILADQSVTCWGSGDVGQLGYSDEEDVGDDETPAERGVVDIGAGRTATAITAGRYHTCAILDGGDVRCWGDEDAMPTLSEDIGDDETPGSEPVVDLGGARAVAISAGGYSTCAITDTDEVWCWGSDVSTRYISDVLPAPANPEMMDLEGLTPAQITLGFDHACLTSTAGELFCWGIGSDGRLGYGNTDDIGYSRAGSTAEAPEPPLSGGPVDVGIGRTVLTASAGDTTTCALLDNLTLLCWGAGPIVGQGIPAVVGDDELPSAVDVVNYNGTAAYTPLSPSRILDTRPSQPSPAGQPKGTVAPGDSIDVQITGEGGVPDEGVYAVVLNVTIAASTDPGFVTAHPAGTSRPTASNINVTGKGQAAPNSVIVPVGDDGEVTLYTSGGSHLIADVFGYFEQTGSATAGRLIGVSPSRIFDTRPSSALPGAKGKVAAGGTIEVAVTGTNGVPATGVSAVVLNVTAAAATGPGFVTVYPGDEDQPSTSNLNLSFAGENRPNAVIVPVSDTGTIKLFSEAGAHLLADVSGYFTDDSAEDTDDGLFVPISPERLLDTRSNGAQVPAGGTTDFAVTGRVGIPSTANAVALNLTAVRSIGQGFVTGWPSDETQPLASNLNVAGADVTIANLAVLPLREPSGRVSLFTEGGAHLLGDTTGYFL